MKKYYLFFIIFLVIIPLGFASNLTRTFSKIKVLSGEEILVNYSVNPQNAQFWAVDEIIPDGWRVKDAEIHKGHLRWYLTQTPTKVYTFIAPNERGIYSFNEGSYQIYGDDNWYTFDPIEIKVAEECMKIYFPLDNYNYSDKKIKLNITLLEQTEYLKYVDYADKRPRATTLCRNCNGYGNIRTKTLTFNDGHHNLSIFATDGLCNETVSFLIDSKEPKISKTEPTRGYANGTFSITYTEENCKSLALSISSPTHGGGGGGSCDSGKNVKRQIIQNLSSFENEIIQYTFTVTDIANNTVSKTVKKLKVDTTAPIIKDFTYNPQGRYVYFNMSIIEQNFDSVDYIDWADRRPIYHPLCSRLDKQNRCIKRQSFSRGPHNVTINAVDEAGNQETRNINFNVNY